MEDQLNKNRINILERKKRYYINNKEKIAEWKKNRYNEIKNTPEYKEKSLRNSQNWRKKSPHIVAWRNLLKRVLYYFDNKKKDRTIVELGYSANGLKTHWLNDSLKMNSLRNIFSNTQNRYLLKECHGKIGVNGILII